MPEKSLLERILEFVFGLFGGIQGPGGAGPGVGEGTGMISGTIPLGSGYSRDDEEWPKRKAIVAFLEANVGDPYIFGAEISLEDADPAGGDCSEYTQQAYNRAGLQYPDGARYQRDFCRGRKVLNPKPGDPFFFGPNKNGIPHTGIYAGHGVVIHAAGRISGGQQVGHVVRAQQVEIEAHPRFEGWYRHPEFAWPTEERA